MTTKTKHCTIVHYNGYLAIEFHTNESIPGEVVSPYDNRGSMGFVIHDVGHVAISEEAHTALKAVGKGSDSIGDIDIFATTDGKYCFGSLGGNMKLVELATVETSRQWVLPALEHFQVIDNEVPEGAAYAIDHD